MINIYIHMTYLRRFVEAQRTVTVILTRHVACGNLNTIFFVKLALSLRELAIRMAIYALTGVLDDDCRVVIVIKGSLLVY